jgi:hypothetical protein
VTQLRTALQAAKDAAKDAAKGKLLVAERAVSEKLLAAEVRAARFEERTSQWS